MTTPARAARGARRARTRRWDSRWSGRRLRGPRPGAPGTCRRECRRPVSPCPPGTVQSGQLERRPDVVVIDPIEVDHRTVRIWTAALQTCRGGLDAERHGDEGVRSDCHGVSPGLTACSGGNLAPSREQSKRMPPVCLNTAFSRPSINRHRISWRQVSGPVPGESLGLMEMRPQARLVVGCQWDDGCSGHEARGSAFGVASTMRYHSSGSNFNARRKRQTSVENVRSRPSTTNTGVVRTSSDCDVDEIATCLYSNTPNLLQPEGCASAVLRTS